MMFMRLTKAVVAQVVTGILATVMMAGSVSAAEDEAAVYAFPDKFMIRLGAYFVDDSSTQFSVSSPVGIGTVIDYQRDLGGDSGDTVPRIDAYYRFNERHRIDFTSFAIDRKGSRVLALDPPIEIDGESFNGGAIDSDIKYTLYKVGYAYSFYHSPKVELSLSAGLNITTYDLSFSDDTGNKSETAGVTAPLPMFGLRMGYAITPKWYAYYIAESFFIDIDDTFKGALVSFELSTEYRLFKHFALGAGLARFSSNVEVASDDWNGSVSDSYSGYRVFGTFYF